MDPEYARVLALAALPLFRSCPELEGTPPTDRETIAEVERVVAEDSERRALIVQLVKELAPEVARRQRADRRTRRKRARVPEPERQPQKAPPKPSPTVFTGEGTASGWRWSRAGSPLRLRARWRR